MQTAAEALPTAIAPVPPSPAIKRSLMTRVQKDARARLAPTRTERPNTPAPSTSLWESLKLRLAPGFAAGGVALAIAVTVWAVSLNGEVARLRAESDQLRTQLTQQTEIAAQVVQLREETQALRQELQAQSNVLSHLASPGAQTMSISGTEALPTAYGQLISDPERNATVLVIAGLPQLEAGKVYQFWWIRGDTPIGAETFRVDADGRAIVEVSSKDAPVSYNAMGVTVEPEGGSQAPTTQPIMLGQIS
jgi:hypothetical protein